MLGDVDRDGEQRCRDDEQTVRERRDRAASIPLCRRSRGCSSAGVIAAIAAYAPGMRRRNVAVGAVLVAAAALTAGAGPAQAQGGQTLLAGAGRADITPPTGYYDDGLGALGRAHDRPAHTALRARDRPPAGRPEDRPRLRGPQRHPRRDGRRRRRRWSPTAASPRPTSSSPPRTPTRRRAASTLPRRTTLLAPSQATLTDFNLPAPARPAALRASWSASSRTAIRRADDDLGPAQAGWGETQLLGLTANRSIEAHLADHGIFEAFGEGSVGDDPLGYAAHDRPRGQRAARRQDRSARPACPDRDVVDVRRPRHGQQVHVPLLQRRPPRLGHARRRVGHPQASAACPPARTSSTPTATPTRATCPPASPAAGRRRPTTSGRDEADAFLQARGIEAGTRMSGAPPFDYALDARVLLRPGGGRRPRGQPGRARPPAVHRLRGGPRAALRHHPRAVRGPAQPGRPRSATRATSCSRPPTPAATSPRRCRSPPCGSATA